MKEKNRTAIYMRVSTASQNHDLQKDSLFEYAGRAGLEIVNEYLDVAVSGRKEGRPALNELMKAARSVSHLLRALEEFNHLNIRFVSVQDQLDTKSLMGKAMFTIIGAMAELESSLISERVKAGMAAAKSRGKKLGRPETPPHLVNKIKLLAKTTDLSINKIKDEIGNKISRATVGQIVKRVRRQLKEV